MKCNIFFSFNLKIVFIPFSCVAEACESKKVRGGNGWWSLRSWNCCVVGWEQDSTDSTQLKQQKLVRHIIICVVIFSLLHSFGYVNHCRDFVIFYTHTTVFRSHHHHHYYQHTHSNRSTHFLFLSHGALHTAVYSFVYYCVIIIATHNCSAVLLLLI